MTFDKAILAAASETNPTRQFLVFTAETHRMNGAEISPAQWLLDNGLECERGPLPKGVRRGELKACFRNSLALAERNGRYVYFEGYATAMIPTEHAWCLDRETGLVVDRTWREDWKGRAYLGVPVKTSYARYCLEQDRSAVMDWMHDFPIMTGEVAEETWKERL